MKRIVPQIGPWEKRVRAQIKDLYLSAHPERGVVVEIEGYDARMKRLRDLAAMLHRREILNVERRQSAAFRYDVQRRMDCARAMIASGGTLMAFDLERSKDRNIVWEAGWTFYRNDALESYNVGLLGNKRWHAFDFGETLFTDQIDMLRRLVRATEEADAYVGHSLVSDFKQLTAMRISIQEHEFFDTAQISRAVPGRVLRSEMLSLGEMCRNYGLEAPHPHCAGNDARYNMELFLKLLGIPFG